MKEFKESLEESVMRAMDCESIEILDYLPYILQDFWEIGSDPLVMIDLIEKHRGNRGTLLDLGCGKGAVSVKVAKELGTKCLGIDGVKEFIEFANQKAIEFGVTNLCRFDCGDIRTKIDDTGKFDVIVLGAIGMVFGDYYTTITRLKKHLNQHGIIILDDGYIDDESDYKHINVLNRGELLKQISRAGMHIAEEVVVNRDEPAFDGYNSEFANLKRRCNELAKRYPQKASIFLDYQKKQEDEYNSLKTDIICSTMVLKKY